MTMLETSASSTTNGAQAQPQYDDGNEVKSLSFKEKSELLGWCNDQYNKCRSDRTIFERQWYMNMAFFFGRQNVQWINTSGQSYRLYEPAAPKWRVRLVVNKVRRAIRTELSKLTKDQPQGFVIPKSVDEEDIASARAGDQIVEYEMRELKFDKILRRAVFWELLCGSSFIKTYWEPNEIDPSGVQGKICVEHVSAFHVLAPILQEEELENQPFIIQATAKPVDWVEARFDKKPTPDAKVGGDALEQRFLSALNVTSNPGKEQVVVREIWVKKCPKFPNGAFMIWTEQELLYLRRTWPYSRYQYPFAKLDHVPTGRFYGSSIIEDMIPVQREYNRTRSQMVESKNRMSKPQLLAIKGSVDPRKITSEPGLVIEVQPGYQFPTPLPLQGIPSYVTEEIERLQREMDDMSAIYEITRGRTPPGVEAASAIAYLQEENDNIFAPSVSSIEEAVERTSQWILYYVSLYWDETRKISVVGENRVWESFEFTKDSISGNTGFMVESGSGAPRSKAAKQAFLMELVDRGIIGPDRMLKYLDMMEAAKVYEDNLVDQRQITREHMRIKMMALQMNPMMMQMQQPEIDPATGQPIPPQPQTLPTNIYDNTIAHVQGHEEFCKSQEFENWNDMQRQMMLQHLQLHYNALQTEEAASQSMQQPQFGPEQQAAGPQEGEPVRNE